MSPPLGNISLQKWIWNEHSADFDPGSIRNILKKTGKNVDTFITMN